jgi:heavy metal sensor kinase
MTSRFVPRSLRGRLLAWYAAVVAIVIAVFGATVCYVFWRSLVARVDADIGASSSMIARSLRAAGGGTFDLELPEEALASFQQPDSRAYYAIWTPHGELIDASNPDAGASSQTPLGARTRGGRRELAVRGPDATLIVVGRELWAERAALRSLALTVSGAGLLALALSLAGGWFLAGRALAPIARIDRTARQMAEGKLDARIPVDRTESELGQVALALNTAFDRLDAERERQRRFTADASHELRTPLTTVLAQLDWALSRQRSSDEYQESMAMCRRAAARMRGVVEGLLTLARADAGELPLARAEVRADRLLEEVAGMLRPLADARGVSFEIRSEPLTIQVDPDRFRDVVTNLVTNAVQYSREDGKVQMSARAVNGAVEFQVVDDGPGIAPEDLPHVFERFYRGDKTRSADGGAGLGLAIARWVVERHGGRISVASRPGRTEFVLRLPM